MEPLVLLDTNVILARCLDPGMDAKGSLVDGVFKTLREDKLVPYITESVRREFQLKLHDRVGQVLGILRTFSKEPPPIPTAGKSSLESMEDLFAKLPQLERYFRQVLENAYAASQQRIRYIFSLSKENMYW